MPRTSPRRSPREPEPGDLFQAAAPARAVKHWLGVVSRRHVQRGRDGGFAQVCHGKAPPLRRMRPGDWLVYYSPTETLEGREPCQRFTALGRIADEEVFQFDMGGGFVPWRRRVAFVPVEEAPIRPLVDDLGFIHDKTRWGFPFRRGCFEISADDMTRIARAMACTLPFARCA